MLGLLELGRLKMFEATLNQAIKRHMVRGGDYGFGIAGASAWLYQDKSARPFPTLREAVDHVPASELRAMDGLLLRVADNFRQLEDTVAYQCVSIVGGLVACRWIEIARPSLADRVRSYRELAYAFAGPLYEFGWQSQSHQTRMLDLPQGSRAELRGIVTSADVIGYFRSRLVDLGADDALILNASRESICGAMGGAFTLAVNNDTPLSIDAVRRASTTSIIIVGIVATNMAGKLANLKSKDETYSALASTLYIDPMVMSLSMDQVSAAMNDAMSALLFVTKEAKGPKLVDHIGSAFDRWCSLHDHAAPGEVARELSDITNLVLKWRSLKG